MNIEWNLLLLPLGNTNCIRELNDLITQFCKYIILLLLYRYVYAYVDDAHGTTNVHIRSSTHLLPKFIRTRLGCVKPGWPILPSLVRKWFCTKYGIFRILPRFSICFIFNCQTLRIWPTNQNIHTRLCLILFCTMLDFKIIIYLLSLLFK